jgi:hypothetical protein
MHTIRMGLAPGCTLGDGAPRRSARFSSPAAQTGRGARQIVRCATARGGAESGFRRQTHKLAGVRARLRAVRRRDALKRLEAIDARQSRVVELRYFGGLTIEETAEVLSVSAVTVKRDWTTDRPPRRRAESWCSPPAWWTCQGPSSAGAPTTACTARSWAHLIALHFRRAAGALAHRSSRRAPRARSPTHHQDADYALARPRAPDCSRRCAEGRPQLCTAMESDAKSAGT